MWCGAATCNVLIEKAMFALLGCRVSTEPQKEENERKANLSYPDHCRYRG